MVNIPVYLQFRNLIYIGWELFAGKAHIFNSIRGDRKIINI